MKRILAHITLYAILLSAVSCTSGRWTVKNTSAIDSTDYEVISSYEFLRQSSRLSPQDPILKLQLFSSTTYRYSEKVLLQRMIQDYRLRPGFVALGIVGAGLAFYAANSNTITGSSSSVKSITLNSAGSLLVLTAFLNMKPVGEPRPTGEERYLRRTGSLVSTDTLQINTTEQTADVDIFYGDQLVRQEVDTPMPSGLLNIDLGSAMNSVSISGNSPRPVYADVRFRDSTYNYQFSLEEILQPFARITSPLAELRNSAEEIPSNILAELVNGSELQIVERIDDRWYKVLYGISENFILQSDAELIWRTSDYSQQSQVVAVPQIPFGNVDVENNIPILSGINRNAVGFIVTNESYKDSLPTRSYANRDGRLINTYLENALGYRPERLFHVQDVESQERFGQTLQQVDRMATDSSDLFVYLSGYTKVNRYDDEYDFRFIPVASEGDSLSSSIDLQEVFRSIAEMPSRRTVVIADLSFRMNGDSALSAQTLELEQPLGQLANIVTSRKESAAVIFGSNMNQQSGLYVSRQGEDKKHRILPYFFAKALQERRSVLSEIYQFLERNISYTSRRLHDRPQDPQFHGNISIELVEDR